MVHRISLLRLSGLAMGCFVVAGCADRTLTAQVAAGVPLAVLLVAAGALALVAALLVWRRRRTAPSHAEGQAGWSVTADGPAARDADFALAPGAARATFEAPEPSEVPAADDAEPPAAESPAADDAEPPATDAEPVTAQRPSTADRSPDPERWSEEAPAAHRDDAAAHGHADASDAEEMGDVPDPTWDAEPRSSTGTRSWFDEPEPAWDDSDTADDGLLDPSSTDRR